MPLLEYRCGSCQARSEMLVLAGDIASPPVCPSCGSRDMRRLLSTFAAHSASGSKAKDAFDPATACGGGTCEMPEACGAGAGMNGCGAGFDGGFGGDDDF